MGIKGFKIDFFDRDDQIAISSTEQLAACAAKHHMLLDLHGLKPFGIQRAYPNILNFEGVKGLENSKWEPIVNGAPLHDFPRYDVTAPYLRQLVGPMDYTPGAMVNATRSLFRSVNDHPMSQGTRVHQMAMYTVFEAPLQMLADSPSKYIKEQECTDFIAKVPTTFDETIALDGKIAEYITIARRKGNTWFVGSMTNWTPRSCTIDLSFLGEGNYEAEIFADGVNADREATDYKKKYASSLPKTNSMYNWHPAVDGQHELQKMNLRKLFLPLCSVALCLQSYAQDKSFLKDMLWYIDNPSVFEKDKRKDTLGICPKEHATEWDMEVFLVRYTGRDTCTLF